MKSLVLVNQNTSTRHARFFGLATFLIGAALSPLAWGQEAQTPAPPAKAPAPAPALAPAETPKKAPNESTSPAATPAESPPAEAAAPANSTAAVDATAVTEAPAHTETPAAGAAPVTATPATATAATVAPATASAATPAPAAAPESAPATPPLTGEGAPKSASANQAATPPADDYDSAETKIAEEEKKPADLMLNIMLDLTIPLAAASDFIGDVSVQGFSLDVRYYAFGNIGIGASVAFDSLSAKETGSVAWGDTTVSGVHRRDLSFTPILLKGYYAWREKEKFIPYVALGAGASRTARRLNAGYFSLENDSWHFTLSPEVGIHIPVGPTVIVANGRLGYLVAGSGQDTQMFGNFSLGISIQ